MPIGVIRYRPFAQGDSLIWRPFQIGGMPSQTRRLIHFLPSPWTEWSPSEQICIFSEPKSRLAILCQFNEFRDAEKLTVLLKHERFCISSLSEVDCI